MSIGAISSATDAVLFGRTNRTWFDPRLSPFYLIIVVQLGFLVAVVQAGWFTFDPEPLTTDALFLTMLAASAMVSRWLTFAALADFVEAGILFFSVAILTPLCAVVLASTNLPLADSWLASLDARLFFGFDRRVFAAFVFDHPVALTIASRSYLSLTWQPFALFFALYATGRADKAWTFLLAWFVALIVTILIFPFAPALSTPPYRMHWVHVLQEVRSGQLRCLGIEALDGIVAFPSFHAAGAVMLGWGYAGFRYLRLPFIALNAAMFVSAIPCGGHYLVDLLAGATVALVSLRVAAKLTRFRR